MSSSPKESENGILADDDRETSASVAKLEKPETSKQDEAGASATEDESAKRRGRAMAKAAVPGAIAVNPKSSARPASEIADRDVKQRGRAMAKATVPGAVAVASGSMPQQAAKGGAPKLSSKVAASLIQPPSEPSITPEITTGKRGQEEIGTSDRVAKQRGRAMAKATVPGAVAVASGSVPQQAAKGGAPKLSSKVAASLIQPPSEPSMTPEITTGKQGQEEVGTLSSSDRVAKQRGRAMAKATVPGAVAVASGSVPQQAAKGGAPKLSSKVAASLIQPPSEPSITPEITTGKRGQEEIGTSDRVAKQRGRAMAKATVPGAVAVASGSVPQQAAKGGAPKLSSKLAASMIQPPSEPSITPEITTGKQGQEEIGTLSSSDRVAKQRGRAMAKASTPGVVAVASGSVPQQAAKGNAPRLATAKHNTDQEVSTTASADAIAKRRGRGLAKATVAGAVIMEAASSTELTSGPLSQSSSNTGQQDLEEEKAKTKEDISAKTLGQSKKEAITSGAVVVAAPNDENNVVSKNKTSSSEFDEKMGATATCQPRPAFKEDHVDEKSKFSKENLMGSKSSADSGSKGIWDSQYISDHDVQKKMAGNDVELGGKNALLGGEAMDPMWAANEGEGPTILEATKVEDEYIPEAMAVSEGEINRMGRRKCMMFLCFLVIAVVISVTVSVKLSQKDDNSTEAPSGVPSMSPFPSTMPSASPSSSPTTDVRGRLEMLVPKHFIENLGVENSAQSEALLWLEMNQTSNTADWTDVVLLEKFAAATLYYSTNGDEWTNNQNWLSDNDICAVRKDAWRGFRCDAGNLTVQLRLDSKKLVGNLPAEVSLFQNLITLRLDENVIKGTIPTELGSMSSLKVIDLSGNNLLGDIPTEIGNMKFITVMDLSDNSLKGHIPSTLSSISGLKILELSDNSLTGSIPTEVGLLSDLTTLSLKENSIFGKIPSELGMNLELKNLELEGNKLTGTLPSLDNSNTTNSTDLRFKKMIKLNLADNSLSGTVPSVIGLLDKLEIFNVQDNGLLTGHIPSEIGVLVGLRELLISGNDLSGPIPSEVGLLHKLPILDVQSLSLTGPLPTEIGMMESLESLLAKENSLTGSIPSEIGQLTELGVLSLAGNDFTGSLPSQLFLSTRLTEMDLSRNDLSGSLPTEVGVLKLLENINLGVNNFSGSIPTEIGLTRSLEVIEIAANKFSGSFPTEIGLLVYLQDFFANNNKFVGSLPTEIGLLTELEYLRFIKTEVTGTLPSEIGLLGRLQFLDMEYENLVGPLPTELGLLADLSKLNFAYTSTLGGPIPSELGLLTSLTELLLGYTNLSGTIPTEICSLLEDKLTQCFDQKFNSCSC